MISWPDTINNVGLNQLQVVKGTITIEQGSKANWCEGQILEQGVGFIAIANRRVHLRQIAIEI